MTLAGTITTRIQKLPEGTTFRYDTLEIPKDKYTTAAKVLERLQTKGLIRKLSKGIFYKPKQTVFGELRPTDGLIMQDYLYDNGKRVAYITGTYLYNQMGLTTQVPNVSKIASFNRRMFVQRGNIKASPVKSYLPITESNYQLLGYLDALKDWNNIPDLDIEQGIKRLRSILKDYNDQQQKQLVKYAIKYPPRVRAFLGALFQSIGESMTIEELRKVLNPLTKYQINGLVKYLDTAKNWNII